MDFYQNYCLRFFQTLLIFPLIIENVNISMVNDQCKTRKIRSTMESTIQRTQLPTTFNNRKHLKGWVNIPIPKQIGDDEPDMKEGRN